MKYLSLIFSTVLILISSCGTEPETGNPINPNIVKIKDCCVINSFDGGDFVWSIWIENDHVITGNELRRLTLDDEFNIKSEEIILENGNLVGISTPSINSTRTKIIYVKSMFANISLGNITEYNLIEDTFIEIKDSTWRIGSAVYWHGDDSKLVYYSYGNEDGLEAGYYLYDKIADSDSLLLAHRSPAGPSEVLNGFDLSPDNAKLLYPDVTATPNTSALPQIIEYDLTTQQADTLDIQFQPSNRIGLWMRYSPDGSEILYVNFPFGALQDVSGGTSEVGLIDIATKTKRILDVDTNDRGDTGSVQLTANWSPDGEHIIYGSGRFILPAGVVGTYSLYILKNVHNSENFKSAIL